MSKPFHFKQFTVHQDKCAMKIGTDGVLLGAWTPIDKEPQSILDIGAGTGIIALMLAQRAGAETIDAIEIEPNAHEQCVENFEASPWADRLFCYHSSLEEFAEEIEEQYHLIVSNPPFYSEDVPSKDLSRDLARQNNALPFEVLIKNVIALLAPQGIFATIVPVKEESTFVTYAATHGLYLKRVTRVKGNPKSDFKRSLLAFSFTQNDVIEDELIIEEQRHKYTKAYSDLTKEFYLKM